MVEELAKSSASKKERSLSLDGIPSLDHGWVDVGPNQGNNGKSISIVSSDRVYGVLKTRYFKDLVINNIFQCLEDDAGYVEDAPNLGKDGVIDMIVANSTAKDGKDYSTDTTLVQVVEDFQEAVDDDVNVDSDEEKKWKDLSKKLLGGLII